MENKSYDIEGMSCASCSQAVEKAAAKVAGVKEATVNLATEKLTVAVDGNHFSEEILKKAVDDAGYVLVANKKEKTFLIEGMSCASCSQTVEKVTRAVAGVSDASVQNQAKKEQHIKNMWRRFWLSAVFTVPLLYLAMGHMLGLPLPMSLHPDMHPVTFALTQLVLTIPVMILGTKFFTVGFKSLFKVGSRDSYPDYLREVLRGRLKRQDFGGHQKIDGLGT
ncbi:MAG: P-type Cu+ transporter [Trichococcus sp.]|nr:P-type Cu+ transporter [Trichococcus sp.]